MSSRLSLAVSLLATAVLSGCQCGGPIPCRSAAECGPSQVCLPIQTCAPRCSAASDCGSGERCSGAGGCVASPGCGADSDCSAGQVCHTPGTCGAPCQSAGCPSGGVCASSGRCVPPGTDGGAPSCGGELFQSTRVQANMLIVLDRSGSMDDEVDNRPKWEIATEAVKQVTARHEAEVRFGLELFPGSNRCQPGSVMVPIGDRHAAEIAAALPSTATGSGTPIGGALQTASEAPELADPARANYVLLVTDGKENCGGDPVQVVRAMFARGVKTYVVGFGGEVDGAMLSSMALEGGTARAASPRYYQADDSASLLATMSAIAQGALGCEFELAKAPPDPSKIYVYVNGQLVPRDANRSNGWEYTAARQRITLYGATCDAVSTDPSARVSIVYGCPDDSLVEGGGGGPGGADDGGVTIN